MKWKTSRTYQTSRRNFLAIVLVATAFAEGAWGAVRCVNPGGTDGCFSGVQLAVDVSLDGDTIAIAEGTYPELVSISGRRSLTLRGAGAAVTKLDPGRIETVDSGRIVISDLSVLNGPAGSVGIQISPFGSSNILRSLVVERSIVSGHPQGGIGAGSFSAKVVDSLVTGIGPGGVAIRAARLILIGSTVADNDGGGIEGHKVVIDRSTITGNVIGVDLDASGAGPGTGKIFRSTIVDNAGVGLVADGPHGAKVKLGQTILAGNKNDTVDCSVDPERLVSRGFNLVQFPSECAAALHPTDMVGVDPVLAPLAENGGATPTRAPQPGSPAVAAIPLKSLCRKPDQRGIERSVPCDVGACEAP